ncbi:MAG: VTT domain-containing protein [Pseudomonadota bacterium]
MARFERSIAWLNRQLAPSLRGYSILFTFSLLESTILPFAIEIVLVPYMLAHRRQAMTIATVTLAGCIAGALLGYAVGALFMETVGLLLIEQFGWTEDFAAYVALFDDYGFWAIIAVGFIPIPFQIAMLGAGAAGYSIVLFLVATFISRGLRYYGLAALVMAFGERTMVLWQRNRLLAGFAVLGAMGLLFLLMTALSQISLSG